MVLHEIPQEGDIRATSLHLCDSVVQIGHVAMYVSKRSYDEIPYGKVEEATHVTLVVANTAYRVIVDFTNHVYPSG